MKKYKHRCVFYLKVVCQGQEIIFETYYSASKAARAYKRYIKKYGKYNTMNFTLHAN